MMRTNNIKTRVNPYPVQFGAGFLSQLRSNFNTALKNTGKRVVGNITEGVVQAIDNPRQIKQIFRRTAGNVKRTLVDSGREQVAASARQIANQFGIKRRRGQSSSSRGSKRQRLTLT